jgi:hypothetical protein
MHHNVIIIPYDILLIITFKGTYRAGPDVPLLGAVCTLTWASLIGCVLDRSLFIDSTV